MQHSFTLCTTVFVVVVALTFAHAGDAAEYDGGMDMIGKRVFRLGSAGEWSILYN